MGRIYEVILPAQAITVAADLYEIAPASNKPCRLLELRLGQTTDQGDAQAETIILSVVTGNTTSGSGGSSATPAPQNTNDPAAGATCEVGNTTAATGGTAVVRKNIPWNILNPLIEVFPESRAPLFNNGDSRMVIRMNAAPADSVTISGSALIEEF